MLRALWLVKIGIVADILGGCTGAPGVGPAQIVIKYTEKCKWSSPTFINAELLFYKRKSQTIFSLSADLINGFSDDYGFSVNVAVEGNGGWRPNFFKYSGGGACMLAKFDRPFFNAVAKQLKAPLPHKCPFPPGKVNFTIEPESSGLAEKMHLAIAPYGEYRITTNVTYGIEVDQCFIFFVDIVPKRNTLKNKG